MAMFVVPILDSAKTLGSVIAIQQDNTRATEKSINIQAVNIKYM